MLVSKLISIAEDQCDEPLDSTQDWIDLFNLCQDDLTLVAKMLVPIDDIAVTVTSGKASIVIADDAGLSTAHRILNVYYTPASGKEIEMRRLQPRDSYSKGWKLDTVNLYLQGLGTESTGIVRVDIYKKLSHITYVESPESYTPASPEIPEEYHGMYISWLCAKNQQREEEPSDKADFMSEYSQTKQTFAIDRLREMEPWNMKELQMIQAQQGGEE